MPIKELPIYEAKINPEADMIVDMVSIVKSPAVTTYNKELFGEGNFLAFNKKEKLQFTNDEEMTLFGIAMMADEPIYRKDDSGYEYYVKFSKDTISEIVQTFFKKSLNHNLNVEHQKIDAKSYIYQSIITDEKKGIKAPEQFGEVPDGSWLIGVKVNDPQLWSDIKAGKRNGFSVEGLFDLFDRDVWIEHEFNNEIEINIDGWMDEHFDSQIQATINQMEYYLKRLS